MWLLYLPLVLGVRMRLAIHLSAVVLWEASIALMVIYHSGMQVAWPGALLARALGGSLRDKSPVFSIAAHDLHHRNGRCNFALFTRWVDAAFGTEGVSRLVMRHWGDERVRCDKVCTPPPATPGPDTRYT